MKEAEKDTGGSGDQSASFTLGLDNKLGKGCVFCPSSSNPTLSRTVDALSKARWCYPLCNLSLSVIVVLTTEQHTHWHCGWIHS